MKQFRYLNIVISVFILCVCMYTRVHACGCTHGTVCMRRPEDNFQDSIFSFYYVGPREPTQVVRLCNRFFLRLSNVAWCISQGSLVEKNGQNESIYLPSYVCIHHLCMYVCRRFIKMVYRLWSS